VIAKMCQVSNFLDN